MEDGSKKKKKTPSWLLWASLILVFVAVVAVILHFLNGQTTIMGEYEGRKSAETLVCESNQVHYTIFAFDESDSKNLKINAVFEDGILSSVSLMYKLNYSDAELLSFSEARNHAEMNKRFRVDGLRPDALSAKYGIINDGMQFSIYAKDDDINSKTLKYFMLDDTVDVDKLTKEKAAEIYNNKDLDCIMRYNKTKEEVNEE